MFRKTVVSCVVTFFLSTPCPASDAVPSAARVNGAYSGLLQVIPCPKDRASKGEFKDYGYWAGGSWCGQHGKAGYWVWVAPKWYVWADDKRAGKKDKREAQGRAGRNSIMFKDPYNTGGWNYNTNQSASPIWNPNRQ